MYYVWFHEFHPGEEDSFVVISQDEYDLLKPHENDLSRGNFPYDEEDEYGNVEGPGLETLVFDTIISRPDADLRPSEIEKIPSENIIEIALC